MKENIPGQCRNPEKKKSRFSTPLVFASIIGATSTSTMANIHQDQEEDIAGNIDTKNPISLTTTPEPEQVAWFGSNEKAYQGYVRRGASEAVQKEHLERMGDLQNIRVNKRKSIRDIQDALRDRNIGGALNSSGNTIRFFLDEAAAEKRAANAVGAMRYYDGKRGVERGNPCGTLNYDEGLCRAAAGGEISGAIAGAIGAATDAKVNARNIETQLNAHKKTLKPKPTILGNLLYNKWTLPRELQKNSDARKKLKGGYNGRIEKINKMVEKSARSACNKFSPGESIQAKMPDGQIVSIYCP